MIPAGAIDTGHNRLTGCLSHAPVSIGCWGDGVKRNRLAGEPTGTGCVARACHRRLQRLGRTVEARGGGWVGAGGPQAEALRLILAVGRSLWAPCGGCGGVLCPPGGDGCGGDGLRAVGDEVVVGGVVEGEQRLLALRDEGVA